MKFLLSVILFLISVNIHSQCLQHKNNSSNSSSVKINTETEKILKSEFGLLKAFFNLDINIVVAESEDGPCYIPTEKLLIAETKFLNELSKKSFGNERVKAVLAHEFAHALQNEAGLMHLWIGGKKVELHADYLAGFYIGRKGLIAKNKLTSFANEFYDLGDFAFFDPDHHGTPEERRCAFLEGYKVAVKYNFNLTQAYNCGVDYIKLLYPCDAFGIIRG